MLTRIVSQSFSCTCTFLHGSFDNFFINLAKMKDESVIVRAQICYDQISDYLSKTITVLACFKYKRYKKNTLTILND